MGDIGSAEWDWVIPFLAFLYDTNKELEIPEPTTEALLRLWYSNLHPQSDLIAYDSPQEKMSSIAYEVP